MSRRRAIINVGAQGVKRHAAFAVPLKTRDFRAAEAARAVDSNALGAEADRRLNGALHGAAERDAALELLGDRFGDERGFRFRLADFDDVDHHFAAGQIGDQLANLVDISALLANHDARTGRVDRDAALFVRTLDDDLGDGGLLKRLGDGFADRHVLVQELGIFALAREPARVPGAVDAEAQPDRINLLTHGFIP